VSTKKFVIIYCDFLYPIDLCTCTMKKSEASFPFRRHANQKLENDNWTYKQWIIILATCPYHCVAYVVPTIRFAAIVEISHLPKWIINVYLCDSEDSGSYSFFFSFMFA
jgi:hypothetical protein